MSLEDIDLDTRTQEILFAASNHDIEALKPFLRVPGAASVQDSETGFTPLHAAIAACGPAILLKPDLNLHGTNLPIKGAINGQAEESQKKGK